MTTAGREATNGAGTPLQLRRGLELLLQAYQYSQELVRDRWDFAVEISSLSEAGLTNSDLRWLLCKGFANHARETTISGEDGRSFKREGDLTLTARSCFVLTSDGMQAANGWSTAEEGAEYPWQAFVESPNDGHVPVHRDARVNGDSRPSWDLDRHEFRVNGEIVKIYKVPSPNQETILAAFEEEGWPPRIDDPLPPTPDVTPKRRLHDTIKSLNRNQKIRLVRFMGDGTGQGVRWELCTARGSNGRSAD